jgi:hypothetical protein
MTAFAVTLYFLFTSPPLPVSTRPPAVAPKAWTTLPLFFGTVIYSFEGAVLVSVRMSRTAL